MAPRIDDWKHIEFASSSGTTPQWAAFSRTMRGHLRTAFAEVGMELVSYNRGHFYFSAFVRNRVTGNMAYVLSSDVRHFPDAWHKALVVRTVEHVRDFTGGRNMEASLAGAPALALAITGENE